MEFDHVAIAVQDHREILRCLTGELGAKVISGGTPPRTGFRAFQARVGLHGMTIEVLEPFGVEHNDFLERFLAAHGEGVHHVTFKVEDVEAELEHLRGLGFEPVGIDFRDPEWREMFIHPRDSHGTVVQIAQANWKPPPMDEWLAGLPGSEWYWGDGAAWWDRSAIRSADRSYQLARLVIGTPDVDAAADFYGGLLGAENVPVGSGMDCVWEDGTIRLESVTRGRASVVRLEVEGGEWEEKTVGGVRFASVGQSDS